MQKRSPIKEKPLRYPGQSLDQEILRLQDEMLYKYGMYAAFFFAIAIMEWYRYATNVLPNPWVFTIVAIVVVAFTTYKILQIKQRIKLLELGRDGERAVGEYLEKLRVKGYAVFHDIVGEGFNIDHVVFAPSGIYAIETKTRSKPTKGYAKVVYDGKKILVDGFELERDLLIQPKSQAKWLRDILQESTGKLFPIQPVILFPGWFVDSTCPPSTTSVWVSNPKLLPSLIENSKQRVSETDLHMASFHLPRYVRSQSS
jgi:hypothetical protein